MKQRSDSKSKKEIQEQRERCGTKRQEGEDDSTLSFDSGSAESFA
jgi:hypothetical protein